MCMHNYPIEQNIYKVLKEPSSTSMYSELEGSSYQHTDELASLFVLYIF